MSSEKYVVDSDILDFSFAFWICRDPALFKKFAAAMIFVLALQTLNVTTHNL